MAVNAYSYTGIIWSIMPALSSGRSISLSQTQDRINDGTLFEWLKAELGEDFGDWTGHDENQRAAVLDQFQSLAVAVDEKRKFGVRDNGLCLIVAYCAECLQQAFAT